MSFLTRLSRARFPYEPLITVEISRKRLLHNLNACRKHAPNGKIAPILKANAYGHGLALVADILESDSALKKEAAIPFFGVDSYFEAVALRSKGIKKPLLIIGYTRPLDMVRSDLKDTAFAVTSLESLKELSGTRHPVRIHLKIDTGMHRQGLLPEELPEAIGLLKSNALIRLDGVYTHLCDADNPDESFTEKQIAIWNRIARQFKAEFKGLRYLHASNSDGLRFTSDIEANVARLGIELYGLSENEKLNASIDPQPVLEMKTIVTGVKRLKAGDAIGYNNTFRAVKDMTIATVPVGYSEGIDRHLSNVGGLLVGPERTVCPIPGRVSMNITTVDVSSLPDVKIGTAVVAISNVTSDPNSAVSIAKKCGTISYETVVRIPAQLKRVVVD